VTSEFSPFFTHIIEIAHCLMSFTTEMSRRMITPQLVSNSMLTVGAPQLRAPTYSPRWPARRLSRKAVSKIADLSTQPASHGRSRHLALNRVRPATDPMQITSCFASRLPNSQRRDDDGSCTGAFRVPPTYLSTNRWRSYHREHDYGVNRVHRLIQ